MVEYELAPQPGEMTKAERIESLLTRACDLGHGRGCTLLANTTDYEYDEGEPPRIRQLYSRACRLGDGHGCTLLAERHRYPETEACPYYDAADVDCHASAAGIERARGYYHRACSLGDGAGCTGEGELLVLSDRFGSAERNFARGCELGDWDGCEYERNLAHYRDEIREDPSQRAVLFNARYFNRPAPDFAAEYDSAYVSVLLQRIIRET